MARPSKPSLNYFPLDCVQNNDLRFIRAKFGLEGYAIVISLWQTIYGQEGYYMRWDQCSQYLFAMETNLSTERVQEVVDCCMHPLTNIFDKRLYETQGILTSNDIQERWLKVIRECKRKGISMKPEYSLLEGTHQESSEMRSQTNQSVASPTESVESSYQSVKSPNNQSVKSPLESVDSFSGITPEETTQRKEKEIKENRIEEEGIGITLRPPLAEQTPAPAEAGSPKKSLEERKLLFRKKMDEVAAGRAPDGMPLLSSPVYSGVLLDKFFQYWTECNDNGRKMRFEMEKVFEMSRRLATWKSKENEFSQRTANRTLQYNSSPLRPSGYEPSRHRDGYGTL